MVLGCTWSAPEGGGMGALVLETAFLDCGRALPRGHLGGEDRLDEGVGQEDFVQEVDPVLSGSAPTPNTYGWVPGHCLGSGTPSPPTN